MKVSVEVIILVRLIFSEAFAQVWDKVFVKISTTWLPYYHLLKTMPVFPLQYETWWRNTGRICRLHTHSCRGWELNCVYLSHWAKSSAFLLPVGLSHKVHNALDGPEDQVESSQTLREALWRQERQWTQQWHCVEMLIKGTLTSLQAVYPRNYLMNHVVFGCSHDH